MKPGDDVECDGLERRRALRAASGSKHVSGLDSVEVVRRSPDEPPVLIVGFIGSAPQELGPEHFVIEGGQTTLPLQVVAMRRGEARAGDDRVQLSLAGEPDRSVHTLRLVMPAGVDPRHDRVSFVFDLDCPRSDCLPAHGCGDSGLTGREPPEIDYLAKDYPSFRRLILDRLSLLLPTWKERREADLGIMLVDLLAYVGDQLSYQQDAVATEAYVGTARQRISLRRHGRLVDYQLHEGNNARAFVQVMLEGADTFSAAWDDVAFATADTRDDAGGRSRGETFLPVRVGETVQFQVHRELDEIAIYTWGDHECCLARGATRATLAVRQGLLAHGDLLLFQEVLGPRTGRPSDADPGHRHVVRLTRVERITDPLHPRRSLVLVEWKVEDALPFPLCLSTITAAPDCARLDKVSVARGNVFLVDHGRWEGPDELGVVPVDDVPDRCDGPGHVIDEERVPGRFRPRIVRGPITFRAPLPVDDPCLPKAQAIASASALVKQDPRAALPMVEVFGDGEPWTARGDLLESGPAERHFVVEIDNQGVAWLRFGDGVLGGHPPACAPMMARYRVGNGPAGNVGRDAITSVVVAGVTLEGIKLQVRNPLPAQGGTAQESMEDARQLVAAPLRHAIQRAITAEDYETIVEREVAGLQNASAELLWNGSWYEAHVAIDPIGTQSVDEMMLCRARRALERVRRIGHDLAVGAALQVPLRIGLRVCAKPSHLRAHVQAAVVRALGRESSADGTRGFFHPDELTFGEPVRLSRLIAKVGAVEGVASVRVERFERLFVGSQAELERGFIPLGRMEVARLDNDPARPENGILDVKVEGGR